MKKRAILALILSLALLVSLLAACGNSEQAAPNGEESNPGNGEEAKLDYGDENEEIVELVMVYFDINNKAEGCGPMMEAFNAITEEKIGVHLNLIPINLGNWATQVSLMLAGTDQLDIIGLTGIPGTNFASMMNNNQLMDISSYLQEDYAAGIMDAVGDNLGAFTRDGGIYGLPSKRDTAAYTNIVMRKDILEELDLLEKAEEMTTWAEYEEILRAVQQARGGNGFYAVSNNDGNAVIGLNNWLCSSVADRGAFDEGQYFDALSDGVSVVACDFDGNVGSLVQTDTYVEHLKMVASWHEEGLLYPEAAFTEETGRTLMKNGVTFSTLNNGEGQLANDFYCATGYEVVCVPIYPSILTTSATLSWGACVSYKCEAPEKAIELLNLLYTDKELINLLTYGIEGSDYTLNEEGEAVFSVADMQWKGSDWLVGNMFLTWPQAGTGGDYRERRLEINEAQERSPFNGFTLDTEELALEISQITAVNDQYTDNLACGGYTDALYQEYIEKLESAGLNDYLAEVQTQLDAWLDAQS